MAFSGDGTRVASGGDDGRVVVWDASSGEQVQAMPERDFSADGWLRTLEPTREAKLSSGASITCDEDGNATLETPLGELYFAPPESFACKGVVQNPDGNVSIVPASNGRPLAVLVVVDSSHRDSTTNAPASASTAARSSPIPMPFSALVTWISG